MRKGQVGLDREIDRGYMIRLTEIPKMWRRKETRDRGTLQTTLPWVFEGEILFVTVSYGQWKLNRP